MRSQAIQATRSVPIYRDENRSQKVILVLLLGLLFLAPLICGTHSPVHDEMGLSHGLCVSVITLAVGAALTIPLLNLLTALPFRAPALYIPLLYDPINKPPQ